MRRQTAGFVPDHRTKDAKQKDSLWQEVYFLALSDTEICEVADDSLSSLTSIT
jgi:hypothetical protein